MYAKPGRLLETLDKVRKADAVPETYARKSGRLALALQKVRETYAAEAEAGTGAPRGVKAFTRMKAAVAESQVIAADDRIDGGVKLDGRLFIAAKTSAGMDVVHLVIADGAEDGP